jgi:hypothetical protein
VDVTVLRYVVDVGPMLNWGPPVVRVVGHAVSAVLKLSVSLLLSTELELYQDLERALTRKLPDSVQKRRER